MQKIIDYEILFSPNSVNLEGFVKYLVRNGWQPLGGLSVTSSDSQSIIMFYQAMVRYDEIS